MRNDRPTYFECSVRRDNLTNFKAKCLFNELFRKAVRVHVQWTCVNHIKSVQDDKLDRSSVLTYSDRSPFSPQIATVEVSVQSVGDTSVEFRAKVECSNCEFVDIVKRNILSFMMTV